ncbi:MAG TPA: TIR domain-containing protein [Planctomycetaceae bacterium]|nr:TIR domain-containing protein [Planctomycetaceae bacterium]
MLFLSHSTKDKPAALDIQQRLLSRGYDPAQLFLDSDEQSGIEAGTKWKQVLYERLKDCRALVVLCSPNWKASQWCFAEFVHADMSGKEIFPVVIADGDIGGIASEHQAVFVTKEGDKAYERLFAALEARHLGPRDQLPWPNLNLKDANGNVDDCPFPGLLAFDERYAGVYFGREPETQTVLEELRKMRTNGEPRLLMIVGGSGSGKSSLLKAGVLLRLKHKTVDTEWLVLPTLRSGESPNEEHTVFDQLARDLAAMFPTDAKHAPDWKLLRDRLANHDAEQAAKTFCETAQDLTFDRHCPDATVLLVVDQFEELLAPSVGLAANRFLHFLKCVFRRSNGRLLAIGTMRSDYLDVYERQPHALTAPFFQPWRLGPFPRERIADVVVKPATCAHVQITDELLERLKLDTPTAEALPLLAFTLEKLYRRYAGDGTLELQEYLDLGGMEGAIQTSIDRIVPLGSLSPETMVALRLSFVTHLAQVNDKDEIVRLTTRWADLPAVAQPVLEQFVKERLLVKSEGNGQVQVEVAQEAMFRCWGDLKVWLGTSADILRWRRDVRRDQASDKKWTGLRPAQLAVARNWLMQRCNELTQDEVSWIKQGIRRQWFWRCIVGGTMVVLVSVTTFAGVQFAKRRELEAQIVELAKSSPELAKLVPQENNRVRSEKPNENSLGMVPTIMKMWQNDSTIRIRFLDGSPDMHATVRQIASQWTEYANLHFDFLPFETGTSDSDVAISFADQGDWSYLGVDALTVPKDQPTMNLGSLAAMSAAEAHYVILREFGHLLGLINEHQSPSARILWNREAVFEYYAKVLGLDRAWVERNVLRRYDDGSLRDFDPDSVMMFPVAKVLTLNGFEVGQNIKLSRGDKELAARLYPRR